MSTNKRLWLVGAAIVGVVAIGVTGKMSLAQSESNPQQALVQSSVGGRYQLTVSGSPNPYLFLLDTQTGRCWQKFQPSEKEWREITPPQLAPK